MKKILLSLTGLLMSLSLLAQGTISTRKHILSDFTDKVTKVVLSGNEMLSAALRQEVVAGWTASAFEFCTLEEFNKLKTSDLYYFLIAAESQFSGPDYPGIYFLSLLKGGPEAAEGIGAMTEIVALPLMPAPGGSGREAVFLGALLKTLQEFTLAAMRSEKTAYGMENWVNRNYSRDGGTMHIYIPQEDLAASVSKNDLDKYLDSDFYIIEDAGEADERYLGGAYNTLVGYSVSPAIPQKGDPCYVMLFESYTGTLYYIGRHRYNEKKGCGFTADDLKFLSRKR